MPRIAWILVALVAGLSPNIRGETEELTLPSKDKVHLFLLIGQSNMAGRGEIGEQDAVTDPRILVYNQEKQWEIAKDPLHWDRPTRTGVGPGMEFARTLLPHLPEDAVIGLIPAAFGGTRIKWWGKEYRGDSTFYGEQYLYPHAVDRALAAMQDGHLAGILWNQGEGDGSAANEDGGADYRARLHQLIADLRSDLDASEVPFIASTLGPWRDTPALNAVFLSLPDEVPLTATVNTHDPEVIEHLRNHPKDPPHYITSSYRLLGRLYAEKYLSVWKSATEGDR